MKRVVVIVALAVALLASGTLVGCDRGVNDETGPLETEGTRSYAIEGAAELEAKVAMGAGELRIEPGTGDDVQTEIDSDPNSLAPDFSYSWGPVNQGAGFVLFQQHDLDAPFSSGMKNDWLVQFPRAVPLTLTVILGAGRGSLELGGLDLRRLTLDMGAGEAIVDLSGQWQEDMTVEIQAGIGKLTLRLPEDTGVRVKGRDSGIGSFTADEGFFLEGDTYMNRAFRPEPPPYQDAVATIEVSIERGVGDVRLETVP